MFILNTFNSLLNSNRSYLIPHTRAMQASITLVVLKPFVQTMLVKLMATLSFYYLARNCIIVSLQTMWTDTFELILANRAILTSNNHKSCALTY